MNTVTRAPAAKAPDEATALVLSKFACSRFAMDKDDIVVNTEAGTVEIDCVCVRKDGTFKGAFVPDLLAEILNAEGTDFRMADFAGAEPGVCSIIVTFRLADLVAQ